MNWQDKLFFSRKFFLDGKSTGYTVDDDGNPQRHVSHHKYSVYPVDDNFGIGIDAGGSRYSRRMATLYPGLGLAILADSWSLKRKEQLFVEKLTRLGYRIAGKRTRQNVYSDRFLGEDKPYTIAARESGVYRSDTVFSQVLENVNAVVESRPNSSVCEIFVFAPSGDTVLRDEPSFTQHYWGKHATRRNVKETHLVRVNNGIVDEPALYKIFTSSEPHEAMGISSKRGPAGLLDPKDWTLYHAPMIDFECRDPESAIRSMERLKLDLQGTVLFDSGASFHAHFPNLVLDEEASKRYLLDLAREEGVCKKWVPLQA
ncbi:MAG: hypothetical protein HY513_00495 [Candidatus Aenigmarchaeota archaeon]|nr:hypothetical protein [Candidatus Aenigmarchaeota archaeon]